MEGSSPSDQVFKTPEGPAPKRRKLSDSGDDNVVCLLSFDPGSPPSSPAHHVAPVYSPKPPTDSRTDTPEYSHSSLASSDNSGDHHTEITSTPSSTPTHSPRRSSSVPPSPSHSSYASSLPPSLPESPSSPCESHPGSHHVHHARLQVVRSNTVAHVKRRVGLVHFARELLPVIDSLPKNPNKCYTIQSLLESFALLEKTEAIVPAMASAKDLAAYHSEEYIEALQNVSKPNLNIDADSDLEASVDLYGFKDDCSPFPSLWQYSRLTAGATILAARYLIECHRDTLPSPSSSPRERSPSPLSHVTNNHNHSSNNNNHATSSNPSITRTKSNEFVEPASPKLSQETPKSSSQDKPSSQESPKTRSNIDSPSPSRISSSSPKPSVIPAPIAINWMGGRHHARNDEASGFCFVNDVVLGILQLLNHFQKVMYIDIDIHHGDGTEEAFKFSKQVLTISFHLHEPGFFPGSGAIDEIGEGKAKYYTINVPYKEGIHDEQYTQSFDKIMLEACATFQPDAIVLVCGADCLKGDPLGGFNLSLHGAEHCIKTLVAANLPLLLLGGGGYHLPSVARLAAIGTAAALGVTLPETIPVHNVSYVDPRTYYLADQRRENQNDEEHMKIVGATVMGNLLHIRSDC